LLRYLPTPQPLDLLTSAVTGRKPLSGIYKSKLSQVMGSLPVEPAQDVLKRLLATSGAGQEWRCWLARAAAGVAIQAKRRCCGGSC
jgi:hypothetical protein